MVHLLLSLTNAVIVYVCFLKILFINSPELFHGKQ